MYKIKMKKKRNLYVEEIDKKKRNNLVLDAKIRYRKCALSPLRVKSIARLPLPPSSISVRARRFNIIEVRSGLLAPVGPLLRGPVRRLGAGSLSLVSRLCAGALLVALSVG